MDFKDYYQILGVSPNVSVKDLKQHYRKLARQYHPDVNSGNKAAEEKFKEINEAYHALSEPGQRKKYDAQRADFLRPKTNYERPTGYNRNSYPGKDTRTQYATTDNMEDPFGGDSPFSSLFNANFGEAQRAQASRSSRPRQGQDIEHEIDITLEEAYHGATRLLQIGDRRIEVKIPPRVDNGYRVRLVGQGFPGFSGGQAGDLYLIIAVLPHPTLKRVGNDLYKDLLVDIYTAVLGGEVPVSTLDGKVMLKIPPQTQAGSNFRLAGKGMPIQGDLNHRGILYAQVKLVLPEHLTAQELMAFSELAVARNKMNTSA